MCFVSELLTEISKKERRAEQYQIEPFLTFFVCVTHKSQKYRQKWKKVLTVKNEGNVTIVFGRASYDL